MKKYLVLMYVLFALCSCSKSPDKRKTYYFYDAKNLFQKKEEITDSSYWLDYWIHVPAHYRDTFFMESVGIAYSLNHSSKCSDCLDTTFAKHKSVLDTLVYFDTEWVKNEKNLHAFWEVDKHGSEYFNLKDSLLIYAIEPIAGTDSLIFRRVRRIYLKDTD